LYPLLSSLARGSIFQGVDDGTRRRALESAAAWAAHPVDPGVLKEIRETIAALGVAPVLDFYGLKPTVQVEAEDRIDPLVRYDVGDRVDAEHYPDGVYWRFPAEDTAGNLEGCGIPGDLTAKRIVVAAGAVAQITDVYRDQQGGCWNAVRKA
jgi:hypothetical protein